VYHPARRAEWLAQLPDGGARVRAEALWAELDALQALRPKEVLGRCFWHRAVDLPTCAVSRCNTVVPE
jgi:hypothetical protein